jgi:hypothetical protein
MTPEDFDIGEDRLYKAGVLKVIEQGITDNYLNFFAVESGEKSYFVYQFENWVFCECGDFKYREGVCKHIAFVQPRFCKTCKRSMPRDQECRKCKQDNAPQIRQEFKSERIGKVKI